MTPSEQARADAMADAETLRLAWRDLCGWPKDPCIFEGWLKSGSGWDRQFARATARQSAHAAFRAVPGLRGDR